MKIESDVRLLDAAQEGLFTSKESFQRFLRTQNAEPEFEQRSYLVRHARPDDLAELDRLEAVCWGKLRAPVERMARRVEIYPEGQFVMDLEGKIAGAVFSQRIDELAQLDGLTDGGAEQLYSPSGSIVQLLAANVDPGFRNRGLGDQLREFVLQISTVTPGVNSVAAVTLCSAYGKHPDVPLKDYIRLRDSEGQAIDPTLRFHNSQGARIIRLMPGYRPADVVNSGNGVLIEYDIHQRYGSADL
ncbi:MAG: ribosomal protein S18 acetylase RimI-like enzyme [Verrucomicrobiales bacterium]|jgi:ribosomal protein S18 acetylase RimI-like enzyme